MIASRDARDGSLAVHQDVDVYATRLDSGDTISYAPRAGRHVWIQVARGAVTLNDSQLEAGDGAAIVEEAQISIVADKKAELLLFDMA